MGSAYLENTAGFDEWLVGFDKVPSQQRRKNAQAHP